MKKHTIFFFSFFSSALPAVFSTAIVSTAIFSTSLVAGFVLAPVEAFGDEISPHTDGAATGATTPSGLPKAAIATAPTADALSSDPTEDNQPVNDTKPQGSMLDRRAGMAMPSAEVDDDVTDSETVDQDDMDFSGFGREEAEKSGE